MRRSLVVFYEYVLATMRNVVGVLAGLNRVYVAPDKLKRVGAVVSRMELTPPDAAARLDALLDLPREQVKPELDDLIARTLDLVDEHLPDVDTTRAREIWSLRAEPSGSPLPAAMRSSARASAAVAVGTPRSSARSKIVLSVSPMRLQRSV